MFAISNPLGWLLNSLGLIRRGVYIALVSAPLIVAAVVAGIPYGPRGVAAAYSTVMVIKVIPITAWALHGTGVRVREILAALSRPQLRAPPRRWSDLRCIPCAGRRCRRIWRLALESVCSERSYVATLFLIAGQQALHLYLDMFRSAKAAPSV